MNVHFFMPWWAIPLIWFGLSVVIVVIRNLFDRDTGPWNYLPLIIDLPVLLIGILGALGIVVGHFLQ